MIKQLSYGDIIRIRSEYYLARAWKVESITLGEMDAIYSLPELDRYDELFKIRLNGGVGKNE